VSPPFLASLIAFSLLSTSVYAAGSNTSDKASANTSNTSTKSTTRTVIKPQTTTDNAQEITKPLNIKPIQDIITMQKKPSEEASNLIQLITLIETSKFDLAYSMGLNMSAEWEGNERFDFNFALAAVQTGNFNQAIFPFVRLLDNNPNNLRFRLELARCYFFLNNLPAAEREFNLVTTSNPPKKVQKNINQFLDRIAEKKQQVSQTWGTGVGIALGYDSNINAAADMDAININFYNTDNVRTGFGILTLDDRQKSQASSYYQLQSYGDYKQPLSKRSSLDARVSASHKDNTISNDYDLTNISLKGGFTFLRNNHNIHLGGTARQYWLAGEKLQNQLLANIRWQWYFAPSWKAQTELEAGHQDNSQNDALDFNQWQSKLGIQRNHQGFIQNLQLSLGANIAKESKNDVQGNNYYSLDYQAQQPVSENQKLYILASVRNNNYASNFADDDIFFAGQLRKDNIKHITAGWIYKLMPTTAVKFQINHSRNQSNLELFDYQRTLIEAGLTLAFQ
jgi:hypothetical protein